MQYLIPILPNHLLLYLLLSVCLFMHFIYWIDSCTNYWYRPTQSPLIVPSPLAVSVYVFHLLNRLTPELLLSYRLLSVCMFLYFIYWIDSCTITGTGLYSSRTVGHLCESESPALSAHEDTHTRKSLSSRAETRAIFYVTSEQRLACYTYPSTPHREGQLARRHVSNQR